MYAEGYDRIVVSNKRKNKNILKKKTHGSKTDTLAVR